MEHKILTLLTIAFLLSDLTNGRVKDPDEDRAYEFGFTIEGMQHRHEKKDVNGIIQGEFGFITADGVYHVTVYATDENGNFRIISMKNIKVSPPLDGSPDFGSTKYSAIPKGPQSKAVQSPVPPASLQPLQVQKRTDAATTKAPYRAFTTKPTIKPACAGCGYVTTSKRPPVELAPKYNQLGEPNGGTFSTGGLPQRAEFSSNSRDGLTGNTKSQEEALHRGALDDSSYLRAPQGGISFKDMKSQVAPDSVKQTRFGKLLPQGPQALANRFGAPINGNVNQGSPGSVPSYTDSFRNAPNEKQQARTGGLLQQDPQAIANRFGAPINGNVKQGYPESVPSYTDSFSNPQNDQNEVLGPNKQHSAPITYRNPESPVKVSNGLIHIPGNPDIPIKDKYPGMTDGLPPGIEEKDISDILYRFNWTVGFQGHYETGYKNGAKVGGYFVTGSDGISRVVTYVADEFGYRPKVKIINLGLNSPEVPKDDKTFELKSFEFVWYPVQ